MPAEVSYLQIQLVTIHARHGGFSWLERTRRCAWATCLHTQIPVESHRAQSLATSAFGDFMALLDWRLPEGSFGIALPKRDWLPNHSARSCEALTTEPYQAIPLEIDPDDAALRKNIFTFRYFAIFFGFSFLIFGTLNSSLTTKVCSILWPPDWTLQRFSVGRLHPPSRTFWVHRC
jgi:hypothetical protein